MSETPAAAEAVLDFWLGPLNEHGFSDDDHRRRWFEKNATFDASIEERFGVLHARASGGELDDWAETPRGRVALVILLDQMSRNLYRDTPSMYANDEKALAVAEQALEKGDADVLACQERYFLYMPFMHAEDRNAQERCVRLFEREQERLPESLAGSFDPKWAVMHRDIVERFGRFPHRNAILGRDSTDEEKAFLEKPGSSF